MLLPALYGVWFPNLCETFELAVDMRAQLGEDGQVLEVAAMVLLDGCVLFPPFVFSEEIVIAFDQLLVDHHCVVGRHLVVGPLGVQGH